MPNDITSRPNQNALTKQSRQVNTLLARAKTLTGPEKKNLLQVCFVCDTTGSMYEIFKAAVNAIKEIMAALENSSGVEMAFIGYKNHGDEKHFDHEKAFAVAPWTNKPLDIHSLMSRISSSGGGDGLTCIEDVMRFINTDLGWRDNKLPRGRADGVFLPDKFVSNGLSSPQQATGYSAPGNKKIVVLIGDMPPHGVVDSINHCPDKINYRDEIEKSKTNGIVYYSVYCDTDTHGLMGEDRKTKIRGFFQEIAEKTGGKCLTLEEIHLLIAILTGICMKETGQMEEFKSWLSNRKPLGSPEQKILKALE